ncbi:tRNA (adenosine(37)-N6)-threonylcarbamoyltransferase complex ATPase subunit type 1 TsaE [Teredinibacter turnerae]|uniref:tRNA (adenosine(37)-N6)-threonylcarbamoyltransferase complex ATPase subunit type 1 TsaE n=1 Tax=Teredinibacter turnerae TaxID=2426 RepID=UPI00036C0E42|nr:tRNA (adenosine(37)-N6)-threonylcarbamoyltransferase complex ATPase subunit type 1 TsaE [Teredinibacter turnerae]
MSQSTTSQSTISLLTTAVYLADEAATVAAGRALGECLTPGVVVYLDGVLGAGKTTFCRGVLSAFGHSGAVKSPTYTLVEPYAFSAANIYHFDLYRLADPEELEYLGIRDYFSSDSISLIEWPVRGEGFLPSADFIAKVLPEGHGRRLELIALSKKGVSVVQAFTDKTG